MKIKNGFNPVLGSIPRLPIDESHFHRLLVYNNHLTIRLVRLKVGPNLLASCIRAKNLVFLVLEIKFFKNSANYNTKSVLLSLIIIMYIRKFMY